MPDPTSYKCLHSLTKPYGKYTINVSLQMKLKPEYCFLHPHTLILKSEILTQIPLQVSDAALSCWKYDHLATDQFIKCPLCKLQVRYEEPYIKT